jgi:hypothetical protein
MSAQDHLIAEFRLPFPPSVNELYVNVTNQWGPKAHSRASTKEYKAWQREAGWMLRQQHVPTITDRVILVIHLDDKRQGDCANREKAVTDVLVKYDVLQGDQKKYVKGVYIGWAECIDCRVSVYNAIHNFDLTRK